MRRAAVVAVFVAVLLAVLVGGHLYLARRLVLDPALPAPGGTVALAALALLAVSLVAHPLADRWCSRRVVRPVAWLASLWMGLAFFLLVGLLATDAFAVLLGAVVREQETWVRARAAGVVALALGAGAVGLAGALRAPALRRIELRPPRWPPALDGYRIIQLSDIHLGPLLDRRFAAAVVARTNALAADLVAITGDLVDGGVRRVGAEVASFGELRAADGVWFVTGNHDYYSGADAWVAFLERLGIRALRNAHVVVTRGDAAFTLAGVEDRHAHLVDPRRREDLPGALAGHDPARPVVLLAHDPTVFPAAAERGVDLQLSGHTHGGQIWPFGYFVRLAVRHVAGLHRRGTSLLYVSCGTGFWGPVMRLGAPAEITEIVLRAPAR